MGYRIKNTDNAGPRPASPKAAKGRKYVSIPTELANDVLYILRLVAQGRPLEGSALHERISAFGKAISAPQPLTLNEVDELLEEMYTPAGPTDEWMSLTQEELDQILEMEGKNRGC